MRWLFEESIAKGKARCTIHLDAWIAQWSIRWCRGRCAVTIPRRELSGESFRALSEMMTAFLDACMVHSDVRAASMVMIMSQTFYREHSAGETDGRAVGGSRHSTASIAGSSAAASGEGFGTAADGAAVGNEQPAEGRDDAEANAADPERQRIFLQVPISRHRIWEDISFWEEVFLVNLRLVQPSPTPSALTQQKLSLIRLQQTQQLILLPRSNGDGHGSSCVDEPHYREVD